jgi:hypothetical protein
MTPRRLLPLVLLLPLAAAPSAAPELTGQVRDERGRPVAGAVVRVPGRSASAVSDAAGAFRLPDTPAARVTAAKEGFLIAGAPAERSPVALTLRPLPAADCEAYRWVDPTPDPARPQNCGNCHGELYREWAGGGHARSATGPHFRNLYDGTDSRGRKGVGWSLLRDRPDAAGVCAACHAPTAAAGAADDFDLRRVSGVAAQGVHCDFCHKVAGTDGTVGLTHGRYFYRLLRPREGQLFFGPLDDVDRGEDAFSPLQRDSRFCAGCHEGTVVGVHAYSTYSEWQRSPAAKAGRQCQGCHLAATGRMTNVAPGHGGIERDAKTLANHRFWSGSQADMLRHALKLDVRAGAAGAVRVEVCADEVGHRLPTGLPDRHVLLVVEGLDAAGRPVAATEGPRLPASAGRELAGRTGRLYAKQLRGFDGRLPVPFWDADPEFTDTRLSPGEPDRSDFRFPEEVTRVRVRLSHRRFWQDVADQKGWTGNETAIVERVVEVRR